MKTTKSALTVARMALAAARNVLPDYSRPKSPHKFTQPQLVACLVVKEFMRLDYRGMQSLLAEWSDLRQVIGLKKTPHFTTLNAASKRLLRKAHTDKLFESTLALCRRAGLLADRTSRAAIDSTGLETRHVSAYFTQRCKQHKSHYKHRYPKLSAICDTRNHLVLAAVIDRGPKPDHCEFEKTLAQTIARQPIGTLLGDAGYESEGAHCLCRDELGIRSIFPTTRRGRPRLDGRAKNITGYYRRLLHRRFPRKTYGQRWQIETVFSMIKRRLGSALRSRNHHSQRREALLRIITHNLMILHAAGCSIQSMTVPYLLPIY